MTDSKTTDISAGRRIEAEIGWCADDPGYLGTISYPPDGENAWIILHDECSLSLAAVRAGLRAAIRQPFWPCRYCADAMLAQTTMFLKDGICEVCKGTKVIVNTDVDRVADIIEEIANA